MLTRLLVQSLDHYGREGRATLVKTHSLAVIGTGYVGLTTGACLASLGHCVVCADAEAQKVERLRRAQVDILEPGLAQAVHDGLESGRLAFVTDTQAAVEAVADEVRDHLPRGCMIVTKSTVPLDTAERVVTLPRRPDVSVVNSRHLPTSATPPPWPSPASCASRAQIGRSSATTR